MPPLGVNSSQLCREAGISYRQLDYWCRSGLVPGQEQAGGSGSSRRFTDDQVAAVLAIARAARIKATPLAELARMSLAGVCPVCRTVAA